MADQDPSYIYPFKSVVLPNRLQYFLAYHMADPVLDVNISDYYQIIEVFYPKLLLPLGLEKDVMIRLFQIMILPFLRRQKSFNKDNCVLSYISADAHPQHRKPYPTRSLVLPPNLIKFIQLYDDVDLNVEATTEEYHNIIDLFHPQLQLPQNFDQSTLISIFDILVRPFFQRLEDFDEDSGCINYVTVEVLPRIKKNKCRVVQLPISLHIFLAFVNHKVNVVPRPTKEQISQIINLFHPHLDEPWVCDDHDRSQVGPFEIMVLPYLRNVLSFNPQTNELTYYAVDL